MTQEHAQTAVESDQWTWLKTRFHDVFTENQSTLRTYFSPGRVNLIGEHIDYNGGMVLPVAISLGTYAVVAKRSDRVVRMISLNFEAQGIVAFSLDDIVYEAAKDWGNYPMGVFHTLHQMGYEVTHGLDVLFYGDLPNGAGLSSSASIEVLTATIAKDFYDLKMTPVEIALLCQRSENQFNGVNCGIMDQFSIAMGKKDHAVLLNCDTLAYEHVPAAIGDYRIVIINTNKKRGLVDSEYNQRRKECERAYESLKVAFKGREIKALCDLTPVEFLTVSESLMDPYVYKRAYHAVVENYRTIQSKEALSQGNLIAFGEWMYSSHESLKHNFEVSCKELDVVVSICRTLRGVIGARMTGAGFGGCAIALVHKDHLLQSTEHIAQKYSELTGLTASFYIAEISGGTDRVE